MSIPDGLLRVDEGQEPPDSYEQANSERVAKFFLSRLFEPYEGRFFVDYRALYPAWSEEHVRGLSRDSESWSAVRDMSFIGGSSAIGIIALRTASQGAKYDSYIGVLPRSVPSGKIESVGQGAWLWADIDCKVGGATAARRMLRLAQANGLPDPQMIVESRNGIHCYWALASNYSLQTPHKRALYSSILKGIARWIGSDMAVTNVNAILRIPGSYHLKVEDDRYLVKADFTGIAGDKNTLTWWSRNIPGYEEPEEYKPRERQAARVGAKFKTTRRGQELLDSPPATGRHLALNTILSGCVYYGHGSEVLDSLAIEFSGKTGLPEAEALRLARHFDRQRSGH